MTTTGEYLSVAGACAGIAIIIASDCQKRGTTPFIPESSG